MTPALILALLLGLAAPALAAGPTVGTTCTASWGAITTDDQGNPLPAGVVIGYKLYVAPGQPASPPDTAVVFITLNTNVQPCLVLPSGQYSSWVKTTADFGSGASASESALSLPFPFVLIRPATPTHSVR